MDLVGDDPGPMALDDVGERRSSVVVNSVPFGLCGWQSRIARAPAAKAASMASIEPPPGAVVAQRTRTCGRPAKSRTSKNGMYTGVVTITGSPGAVSNSTPTSIPRMTSGASMTSAGSTGQPNRRSKNPPSHPPVR